ncbi:MAG: protein kinase [Gemmatimonas sp.]
MTDLREQLEHVLGATYRIERELGGGGMSRVFLAEETALSRQVVIKVLPPEMAASVNQDRFRREVQLAARLQHPHIVPLLTAGASGDLLYYVMPFIKGESLREKLDRESELPIGAAVRILREVTDALAYAHSEGVVHRDIKPDNVMISGGHALVTDFGVAKAVSDSTGSSSLTSFGLAIGTPAYMAPEQASGDPNVDHRADLYALGATAFEMLAGRPPFIGRNAQALLAAHVTQQPEPVNQVRPAVPVGLNSVVMRCLEKHAADRWQHATELLPYFDLLLTPSTGGTAPTNAAYFDSSATEVALRRSQPHRVLATFALTSVGVLGISWLLVQQMGLPMWVFYSAMALLVVGFPVVLLTGKREREVALARTTNAIVPVTTGVERHLTWRNAVMGGAIAFAALGVLAMAYTAMRLLGVGSVGTLMAQGTLNERDRIVLAEFENRTGDTTLATTVTELFRTDLAQSRAVSVYDAAQLASVVARMQLPASTRITFAVAKDAATREGLKAVLAGEIAALGSAYVLSARLVATNTGDVLWAARENVPNAAGLSAAIDRLSGALRARVGESLRSIRADPPLEQITTSSTEALRLYAQAERAANVADNDGAIGLLQNAIKEDSNFAMAYRRIGFLYRNRSRDTALYRAPLRRAYQLRDRLSMRERYLTDAAYFSIVMNDTLQAISAYQALLDRYPDDRAAANNLAVIYSGQGKKREALTLYTKTINLGGAQATTYSNALRVAIGIDGVDSAGVLIDAWQKAYPENPNAILWKADYYLAKEQFDSAKSIFEQRRSATKGDARAQLPILDGLISVASVEGRVEDAFALLKEILAANAQLNGPRAAGGLTESENTELELLKQRAQVALDLLEDTTKALALKSQELSRFPLNKRGADPGGDNYLNVAIFYAKVNRPTLARPYLTKWEASVSDKVRSNPPGAAVDARAEIAVAEGRFDDALREYRKLREQNTTCLQCDLQEIARVFEKSGRRDSAIVSLKAYFDAPRLNVRGQPGDFEQLARLYEQQGDTANAIRMYTKVVDYWKNADAALQFRVTRARERIGQLSAAKPK